MNAKVITLVLQMAVEIAPILITAGVQIKAVVVKYLGSAQIAGVMTQLHRAAETKQEDKTDAQGV